MKHGAFCWATAQLALAAYLGACASDVAGAEDSTQAVTTNAALFRPVATLDCSDEDASNVIAMAESASDYIVDALNDIHNVQDGGDATRITYWLGKPDPDLVNNAEKAFSNMSQWVYSMTYRCGCPGADPSVIARSTPHDPNQPIELCDVALHRDFREYGVGSMIHELSHVAGTLDYGACHPDSGDHWPDDYHDLAGDLTFGYSCAESYRLYALGWHQGQASTGSCFVD